MKNNSQEIPVYHKITLTIKEASEYQLFFNRRFTRASAKNDVTWEALYGSPDDRYKNKGLHYAKTLGVSK